ncbi:thiamine-phosphate kinase [Elusimicrobiota bacterium]
MKTISEIGEFGFISDIRKNLKYNSRNIVVGNGDDCAVLKYGNKLLLFTTDSIVEDIHFKKDWFTPLQIGKKAVEINVSDIAAMGGKPKYMLVSLFLPKNTELSYIKAVYRGLKKCCDKYSIALIGGNMSEGSQLILSLTLIGEVSKADLTLRNGAKPGDNIYITGPLGKAAAGMDAIILNTKKQCSLKDAFLEPEAKLTQASKIAKYATSMIDLSDGLVSDLNHIIIESGCGAILEEETIPVNNSVKKLAQRSGKKALDYALYGGEDYELLFTVSPENLKLMDAIFIGKITKGKDLILENRSGRIKLKEKAYNHFIKS